MRGRSYPPLLGVALLALLSVGCPESRYTGDGKLSDDPLSPSERFVLTLGTADLSEPSITTHRLSGLPEKSFALGFEISGGPSELQPLYEKEPVSAVVRFTLTDERSRVIIDETAPLNEWTWSGSPHEPAAFVYRGGASRDVPMSGGYVNPQPVGVKPDQGWGTYFTPRSDGRYTLRIEVLKEDPLAGSFVVVVKGKTGGWE